MKDNIFALYSTSFRMLEEEIEKITGGNSYTTYNLDEMEIDDAFLGLPDDYVKILKKVYR